jgi:hypothetical protein
MGTAWVVLLAVLVAIALASPVRAERVEGVPNWPELLPPGSEASGQKVRLAFDACRRGRKRCPRRVVREMYGRWQPLDASCDHRAVFALTYLRTTEEFVRTVTANRHFFSRRRWIKHEDTVFAELYFRAYDRWVRGRPVPEAWRMAFEANASANVTGIGDLLLGMNAHINRDLPYALAHVGLRKRDGRSRKPDHDRVNAFLERVADPLQRELAERYDPIFEFTDAEPSPADETGALEAVRSFRENAWRNAERLVAARDDPEELAAVRQSIELEAEASAHAIIAANTVPNYTEVRDAHCRA